MANQIETIARQSPVEYQLSSGTTLTIPLYPTIIEDDDVHIAHVGYSANSVISAVSDGWVLAGAEAAIRSGSSYGHIAQEIWVYVVQPGSTPPDSVTFTFSQAFGEKWVGITTLRYADVAALVSALAGEVPGEPDVLLAAMYAYVQVQDALSRGERAFGYSYVRILQRLVADKNATTYSYVRVLNRLTADKVGVGYSYVEITEPPP